MDDFHSASKERRRSLAGDLSGWIRSTRKYWLIPLILILLLLSGILILGQTALGPFLYTIF